MKTDDLIHKYFEGETSCEEEKRLREYFNSGHVAEHLKIYIPLFTYFEQEINKEQKVTLRHPGRRKRIVTLLTGIAASLLILVVAGIGKWLSQPDDCLCAGDYVVINGKCYKDKNIIKTYAVRALQEVGSPISIENQ
ncbi:MAG: hypothetical protein LIP01_11535 [Tannerellaceae bacterium]|nr:hypothetical protein [Tannerellaceae bacterium]